MTPELSDTLVKANLVSLIGSNHTLRFSNSLVGRSGVIFAKYRILPLISLTQLLRRVGSLQAIMTVISTSSDRLLNLLRSAKDMFFDENSHLSEEEKEESWAKRRSELTSALGSEQQGPVTGAPDLKKQQSVGLLVRMQSLSKLMLV